ncbi:hypothetical protein NDU88_000271 [Pleurodeles waltl]|uniref:Uncharacterized protein n=1 Tax=Pleurodeles waltl TaxID=8319 RepID=A0AAV7VWW1_PLEWA|nr:hypothetical protein NDU88_000271 [Pleurodeles waltl]
MRALISCAVAFVLHLYPLIRDLRSPFLFKSVASVEREQAVFTTPYLPNITVAYHADEEEQYQELQEVPIEHQMEERLVEALGHPVQDSMNWALIQALKPLANFGRREFLGEGSQQPCLQAGESREVYGLSLQRSGGSSSAEILA